MWLFPALKFSHDTVRLLDSVSGLSAYMSISFWLFAQLPQVIKNHTDKSVDGFSLGFLMCWFAGDFLNLVSCILNDAMMFQILLSGYYCSIDIILAAQYYYYKNMYHNPESKWYHRPHHHHKIYNSPRTSLRANLETGRSIDSHVLSTEEQNKSRVTGIFKKKPTGTTRVITSALLTGITKVEGVPIPPLVGTSSYPRKENNSAIYYLFRSLFVIFTQNMGKTLAWSCTALYLFSRIPQIYTNYKLKSTSGISLKLICFALCGNFFYSMSLLLCESSTMGGEVSKEFWIAEISYFIGALGTVLFDFSVLLQWYFYDCKTREMTKSGKLKARTPKLQKFVASPILRKTPKLPSESKSKSSTQPQTIDHPIMYKISDPIEMSESVKMSLSPNHMKKLSEFTPLSPMDFLLENYRYGSTTNASSKGATDLHSRRSSLLSPPLLLEPSAQAHLASEEMFNQDR